MSFRIDDTPPAHGKPLLTATLKEQPSDFVVNELLEIDFDDSGEHLYLQVEKTSLNTDELVSVIETAYSVGSADVGIAGLKDRHAVTTQWVSVRTPGDVSVFASAVTQFNSSQEAVSGISIGEIQPVKSLKIVASARHSRKLRRGAHRGNHFVITLRNVSSTADPLSDEEQEQEQEQEQATVESLLIDRILQIRLLGFPNYIGPQRFGFGGQNLIRARQWFKQPKKRASRQQRSLWLSASRSIIFNSVCAARVQGQTWSTLLAGEPAVLNGTRSFFLPDDTEDVEVLNRRLAEYDIHPSAPWWGRGRPEAKGECEQFEQVILEPFADLCAGLERAGLTQERRALRALASELSHQWVDKTTLRLSFHLSPGVFATTLLREIADVREPDRRSMNS